MPRSPGRAGPPSRLPRALGAAAAALALLVVLPSTSAHPAPPARAPLSVSAQPRPVPAAPPPVPARAPAGSGAVPTPTPTARPAPAPVWTAHLVRAAGVQQWIECAGTGPVTVVVVPGLGATHAMWNRVLPSFAGLTRTCVYDRPGLGASPARSPHATVDAGRHADELMALLAADHVTGPLVVVGHSYGGLVARALVARYRDHVAGLMLVEGVAPYDRLAPYWGEGGDRVDTRRSSAAADRMRLGSLPLVVEAAQDPDRSYWGGPSYGSTASDIADWRAHQRAAAALSTSSTFVIVSRSAHVIERDRPDAVVAGLRLLVRAVERRAALPHCALGAYGSQPLCA